jgi:hypothetical protein
MSILGDIAGGIGDLFKDDKGNTNWRLIAGGLGGFA